jgi:hypothetical protein
MTRNRFLRDLKRGGVAEELVVELLKSAQFDAAADKKARQQWDVVADHLTVEVKFDEYEQKSGNVAIEVFNPRLGKPSGLTATEAFLWAHVLADGVVWITTVTALKKYLDKHNPDRIIERGGDNNATLYLYPSCEILPDVFHRIDDLTGAQIRAWVDRQWEAHNE